MTCSTSKGIINALEEAGYTVKGHEGELLALFSRIESPVQIESPSLPYPKILEKTLELMIAERAPENGPMSAEMLQKFGQSVEHWPAFPDSADALVYLQQHYKLVILSNIDRESFNTSEAKLGVKFDAIVTAQDVGSYKPGLNHFTQGLQRIKELWGFEKEQVLHTFQSLYHDAVPANQLKISTSHINRVPLAPNGGATPQVSIPLHLDFVFDTLGEMAAAHRKLVP